MEKVIEVLGNPAMWNILIFVIVPVIIVVANRYLKGKEWEEVREFINDVVRQVEQMKKMGIITGTVEQMRSNMLSVAIEKVVRAFPWTAKYENIIRTKIDSAVKWMNETRQ